MTIEQDYYITIIDGLSREELWTERSYDPDYIAGVLAMTVVLIEPEEHIVSNLPIDSYIMRNNVRTQDIKEGLGTENMFNIWLMAPDRNTYNMYSFSSLSFVEGIERVLRASGEKDSTYMYGSVFDDH